MLQFAVKLFLRLRGWEAEGGPPSERKFVLIAAPHTSNWDLLYLLALSVIFDVKISWMGKHTIFRPPHGWILKRLGGIPIRRHERGNMVERMARAFEEADSLALIVPAEGSRSCVPHWKSGFYHIARTAGVPVILGYLDYGRRRGGFGPALRPSGDIRRDMDQIRAFYADKVGKHPDQFGEIRLEEEMEARKGNERTLASAPSPRVMRAAQGPVVQAGQRSAGNEGNGLLPPNCDEQGIQDR